MRQKILLKHVFQFFFLLVFSGASTLLSAQDRTLTGTVQDDEGIPLIGANILVKGESVGTVTDVNGAYSLQVPEDARTLVVSYVGYSKKEITILPDVDNYDIVLQSEVELEEVVVTALGVERDEKALGYSVQQLSNEKIAAVKPVNVVDALAGKVSGVFITGSASGPTASSNINIRGESSLTGNNQPLFVVNGMPITNSLNTPGDGLNGSTTIDFGNAAQIVNPDDIESVNVLKGPAAAALYGSRASNGVILIRTKTGKKNEGWGVEINSTTMFEDILKLPNYQNEYGFGGYGFYSYNGGETYTTADDGTRYYDAFGENWGPRLDGQDIIQFNTEGEPRPYTPAPDNVRDFFRTGVTAINNIALSNGDEDGDFRLSYTNLSRRGIVPNTNLNRNTFYTSVGKRLFDRLDVRLNGMYIRSSSDNVPNAGYDESSSVMYGWLWYPRQVPINDLKDYWVPGQEGEQQRYVEELWVNNPWFVANENTNSFQSNRVIGNVEVNYEILPNFSARFRFGADVQDEQRQFRRARSTKGIPGQFGSYREDGISFTETNTEFLLSYGSDKTNGTLFDYDFKVGGNIMRQRTNFLSANNPQLFFPDQYTLTNNRTEVQTENILQERGINSAFGLASFSFDNFLYLDVTARNDWSSTLPEGENSYFYPSVSMSAVLSEKMNLGVGSALSFLKIRAAYAEVGNDTDPYLLSNTFNPAASFGNFPAFTTSPNGGNPGLIPERTESWEAGVDVRFLNGRIRLDATYYDMLTSNQIILQPVSVASGKEFKLENAGEIRNRGVEVLLSVEPIRKKDFSWVVDINVGHNRAVVEQLPEEVGDVYPIVSDVFPGDEGSANLEYVAIEGELYGQLYGLGFARDPEGNIIHEDGLPVLTQEKVSAGSYQPDVRLGVYNTFNYKNFSFGFLFDGQIGGQIYSRSHALYNTGGTITNEDDPNLDLTTLEGRPSYEISYDQSGRPIYDPVDPGGVVGPGVKNIGTDENPEYVDNDVSVPTRDYFYAYYGNGFNRDNIEAATYDATYFKLREVRLSYRLPASFTDKAGLGRATVSLVGRNLLLFTDVPSIDPETYSIRNGIFVNGFESTQLPSTRSYGISINLGF